MTSLRELLDRFPKRTVLVVGDVVADEFVFGEISRVSREAPVLLLKRRNSEIVPGGGANAACNIAALGARVLPVGAVGDDAAGQALIAKFRECGIETRGIIVAKEFRTTVKSRILAGTVHGPRQQVLRIDSEPDQPLSKKRRDELCVHALRFVSRADAILLSDYGYGTVTPAVFDTLRAAAGKCPITVDSRYDMLKYTGATAATPNEPEVEAALHIHIGNDLKQLEQAGRDILRRLRARAAVITRGRDGMALFEPGRPAVHIPIWGSDQIADVTGAGDTVIAAFTLALAAGATFEQAARLANFAGGIVVMKPGTATVALQELRAAVESAGA